MSEETPLHLIIAAFDDEARHREGLLAGVLEHHVDVDTLAGDVPDRLAEFAAALHVLGVRFLVVDVGQLPPTIEAFRKSTMQFTRIVPCYLKVLQYSKNQTRHIEYN